MRYFLKTVAVVTVFSICEKILGFTYRIFLSRTIGTEGVGLYQVALSTFGLFFTIACSGVPVTVSRLMTKYKAENNDDHVYSVVTAGFCCTLAITVPIVILTLIFKDSLSFLFADPRCLNVFIAVIPGLIFSAVYSVMRGVFWGSKDFLPYSVIELLEEAVMILAGIILVSLSSDAADGAVKAAIAVLVSYAFSFTASIIVFITRKHKLSSPKTQLKPLIKASAPVSAMRAASSFAVSLVSVILPLRLVSSGYSESQAMSAFGAAAGQAIPLLSVPTTLIGSFTIVLIPEIAENYYGKKHLALKLDVEKAVKISSAVSCLFIPVFTVLGEDIGVLIFASGETGNYLTYSAALMPFICISNVTTSILNSMGLENKTLAFFFVGGVLMLLSIWFLPPVCGIYSLLIGFAFVYVVTTLCNLILLNKKCTQKPSYGKFIIKTVNAVIPSVFFGFSLKILVRPILGTFFTFFVESIILVLFTVCAYLVVGTVNLHTFAIEAKNFSANKKRKAKAAK